MLPIISSLCLIACIVSVLAGRKAIRSGGTPYIINIKGKRFIPLMSFALLSLILLLGTLALKITDVSITDYSEWQYENNNRIMMTLDKTYPTDEAERIGLRERSITKDRFKTSDIIHLGYPLTRLSANKNTDGPASGCRIAVLGDSFVWGESLINQNSVMYRQLKYELSKRGYDCTVWGIGVGGASTYDEYTWLSQSNLLEDIKPNIILIGYVRNDPVLPHRENVYEQTSAVSILRNCLALPAKAMDAFCPNLSYLLANRLHSSEYMDQNLSYVSEEHLSVYEDEVVKPLSELVRSKGLNTAIVSFPRITESPYNNRFYPPVKALYEEYGIPYFDCTEEYTDYFSSKIHSANVAANPVDLHPGTASNRFFATYMADILEANYSSLLGEKHETVEKEYALTVNDWLPIKLNVTEVSATAHAGVFKLEYPQENASNCFLYLPVKKKHVAVSFAFPADIKGITLKGNGLVSAEIWYNSVNEELGYDDLQYCPLGQKQGKTCGWSGLDAERVTTLLIHAETENGSKCALELTVTCDKGGSHP